MAIGKKMFIYVHEKCIEEAALIEARGDVALVEWRGAFCEVVTKRLKEKREPISSMKTNRLLEA
jgi:hypothetical protein